MLFAKIPLPVVLMAVGFEISSFLFRLWGMLFFQRFFFLFGVLGMIMGTGLVMFLLFRAMVLNVSQNEDQCEDEDKDQDEDQYEGQYELRRDPQNEEQYEPLQKSFVTWIIIFAVLLVTFINILLTNNLCLHDGMIIGTVTFLLFGAMVLTVSKYESEDEDQYESEDEDQY